MADRYADYEPVADRLEKFWNEWPDGRVETSYDFDGTGWTFRAELYRKYSATQPAASGHARQELFHNPPEGRGGKPNQYAPEFTNPVEVAETSAIGRALANLGWRAKKGAEGRPSREEMDRTARNPDFTYATKEAVLEIVGGDTGLAKSLWGALAVQGPVTSEVQKGVLVEEATRLYNNWEGTP